MSAESEAKSSNILLREQKKLVDELRARYRALQYQVKETYKTQKGELKGVTDGTKSQEKATQAVTETLKKQADVVDKNKQKLEEMMKKGTESLQQIKSKVGAVTGAISAIGGPLVTGALGVLGGGLAGMLKENETLKASLESVKSSLQGAFAPITEAVLPLVDTFAQTISGLAQTVAPLLSNVLGSVSKVAAGMLGGVDLSGLLTPLTAGLDGILALFSKLGQATGTWMQGLDLSGLAGSFAGETHRKRDGRGRQDKAKGGDAYGCGGVKEKAPFGTKGAENEGRVIVTSPAAAFSYSSWVMMPESSSSLKALRDCTTSLVSAELEKSGEVEVLF